MSVTLTQERKEKLRACSTQLLHSKQLTIRDVAKVIGMIVAIFPAIKYGALHYCHLENDRKFALKAHKGNFDCFIVLSISAKIELQWWIDNIDTATNDTVVKEPEVTLTSDASRQGWGCTFQGCCSGGAWLPAETTFHMNYLELKAAFFALQCFQKQIL